MSGEVDREEERPGPTRDQPGTESDSGEFGEDKKTRLPGPSGWASHLEGLVAARRERRRRMATRLWYMAIPVALAVILAMALLSVYGGIGGDEIPATPTTVAMRQPVEGSGLLLIEDQGRLLAAAAIQPWDQGGIVLAIPGITLLESEGGFLTLTEIYLAGRTSAVEEAITKAFDTAPSAVAVVGWSDLDAAMTTAGVQRTPSDPAAPEDNDATARPEPLLGESAVDGLAHELWYFMATAITDLGSNLWYQLDITGNVAGFLDAVVLDAGSMAVHEWSASGLQGSLVAGEDFTYLEPDVEDARTLLDIASRQVGISVEVNDGAGVDGAPELAGDLLESAGYSLLPMGYAEAFPGVEKTQIVVSPSTIGEAQRVRDLLGMGEIVEDATLEKDRMVVILGKDFGQELPRESESVE